MRTESCFASLLVTLALNRGTKAADDSPNFFGIRKQGIKSRFIDVANVERNIELGAQLSTR